MGNRTEQMANPSIVGCATSTANADAVVTITAKSSTNLSMTTFVTGIILSANAAITTSGGVAATLTNVQGGTLTFQIPASAIAPVVLLFGVHPLRVTPGQNTVLTLPALGASVVGTATLLYYYGAE